MRKKLVGICVIALVLVLLLTMTPACGNGEEEAMTPTPTVGPGVTPTPGQTPTATPTGEVKTMKIGYVGPLSGPAAGWGVAMREGVEWAAARINEAGGLQVGDDTYFIEVPACDTKLMGSVAAECATRMRFEEKVLMITGIFDHASALAVEPILQEGKIFMGTQSGAQPNDAQYWWESSGAGEEWAYPLTNAVLEKHSEIETMEIILSPDPTRETIGEFIAGVAADHGVTTHTTTYTAGTVDFYPILTKIVADNPDIVHFDNSWAGDVFLMIKQLRELGYQGMIMGTEGMPHILDILGAEVAEGVICNESNWQDPIWGEAVNELYRDYCQRYPQYEGYLDGSVCFSYSAVMCYTQAAVDAGTTDPDAVLAAMRDPDFRYEFFGYESSLGGEETYGVRGYASFYLPYAVIENGQIVTYELMWTEIP